MMKKTLIMASLLVFALSTTVSAQETPAVKGKPANSLQKTVKPQPNKKRVDFDKRLKLTDEQKVQAKEIRKKGFEQLKPIVDKIKDKKQQIETVKLSKISVQVQQERINKLNKEILELRKTAHEIRVQNMKEFEAILTKKQLKELNKIKEEGRKKYEQERKKHPRPDHFGTHPSPERFTHPPIK